MRLRRIFNALPLPYAAFLLLLLSLLFAGQLSRTRAVNAQAVTPIHAIQGSGTASPLVGQSVTTTGIVTALKTGSSGGFFLQTPEAEADSDPNTSQGLFIFTGSTLPAAAVIGNRLQVTGNVTEFRPSSDPLSPTLTELTGTLQISILSTANSLPAVVTLTNTEISPIGSIEQLERFEAMRVRVALLDVIAPTDGNVNEVNATGSSNGIFFGVINGIARPFREPGIEVPEPLPSGAPLNIPRFDANPERLRVDSDALSGAVALNVTTGVQLSNVIGLLDYSSRNWTLLIDPPAVTPTPAINGLLAAVPVAAPAADEITIASFNLERFFNDVDDPGSDPVLTQTAFHNRLNKASLTIRNVLRLPDIIGVEEMEDLATLQLLAFVLNRDARNAGQADPLYQAALAEGNDPGGIDVGFLVKRSRVSVTDVQQFGKDATYVNPTSGQMDVLNDRPPLLLRASVTNPGGAAFEVTVIVNHLRSLLDIGDVTAGARVRAKRRAQAEFLANLIQTRQQASAAERIVVLGDFNAYQFNDGYVDTMGTIKGSPTVADQVTLASSDLVTPDLVNLIDTIPASQRYSYNFNGSAQALDHILISANLLTRVRRFEYARCNADFPETFRSDATRPERLSDHDPALLTLSFNANAATVSAASYDGARLAPESIVAAFGAALAMGTEVASTVPLPITLAGTTIKVRDSQNVERNAPLFFVAPGQINYLIPKDTANGQAMMTITSSSGEISTGTIQIANVSPALFAANADGQGVAAAQALRVRDGALIYEPATKFDTVQNKVVTEPIDLGPVTDRMYVLLFGTGIRQRTALENVSVSIGGEPCVVEYAGAQGGFVGLDQLNVVLPRTLIGRGEVDVRLTVDGLNANPVKIRIK